MPLLVLGAPGLRSARRLESMDVEAHLDLLGVWSQESRYCRNLNSCRFYGPMSSNIPQSDVDNYVRLDILPQSWHFL